MQSLYLGSEFKIYCVCNRDIKVGEGCVTPGVDLRKDVLYRMDFILIITDDVGYMDAALFC